MEKFFNKDPKKRTIFDRINCEFVIHYVLKNETTWNNFKANINMYLRNGGYIFLTTLDGQRVNEVLKETGKLSVFTTNDKGEKELLFEIIKKYDDVKPNTIIGLGNAIDVHMSWISNEGVYITEYLVDSRFVIKDLLETCNLELVDTDLFDNQMEIHKEYLTKYAKYDANEKNKKMLADVANYYKQTEINLGCYQNSRLSRYYVFRKNETNLKGGSKKQKYDFTSSKQFSLGNIDEYDNDYSCVSSIYHVLRTHKIIPKHVSPKEFYKDMGIKIKNDVEINDKYIKKICNKLLIQHEIEGKVKTALDGVNVVVLERDCNDNIDVTKITKNKTNEDDKTIVLMRDGNLYLPVYLNDEHMNRTGIFNDDHDLLKEIKKL
jgi:hypothetical protein